METELSHVCIFYQLPVTYKDTSRVSQLHWLSMISEDNSSVIVLWTSCPSYFGSMSFYILYPLKDSSWGFPGGAVVKNPPANAGDHGFEPWSRKIPHAAEQLGPWATITEPACLETVLRNQRGRDSERPAHCDEEWPPLAATGESPRTETKPNTAKNK